MVSEEQKRANRRLGFILATVALCFGLGFMVKIIYLGR